MEEAAEVEQIASKALRFGLWNHHPNEKIPNAEHLVKELHDVRAMWEMLCEEKAIPCEICNAIIEEKKKKVRQYMKVSQECGTLDRVK